MSEFEKKWNEIKEEMDLRGTFKYDWVAKLLWLECAKWVFNSNLCGGYSAKRIKQEIKELEKENQNG